MERKDFVLIASIIKANEPKKSFLDKHQQWEEMARAFTIALSKTNELFDEIRFSNACGLNK